MPAAQTHPGKGTRTPLAARQPLTGVAEIQVAFAAAAVVAAQG